MPNIFQASLRGMRSAEGDETDNAQYYCEEARKAAEQAAGSVGFDGTASSVSAVDTHNLTGAGAGKKSTVQNLLDVIAQKLVEKVVTSDTFQIVLAKYLVNNGLTTEAGKFGLDAAFGKNLQDQITQQNSNFSFVANDLNQVPSEVKFFKYNGNAQNSPVVNAGIGLQLYYDQNFKVQIVIDYGKSNSLWIRKTHEGQFLAWTKIL